MSQAEKKADIKKKEKEARNLLSETRTHHQTLGASFSSSEFSEAC